MIDSKKAYDTVPHMLNSECLDICETPESIKSFVM